MHPVLRLIKSKSKNADLKLPELYCLGGGGGRGGSGGGVGGSWGVNGKSDAGEGKIFSFQDLNFASWNQLDLKSFEFFN